MQLCWYTFVQRKQKERVLGNVSNFRPTSFIHAIAKLIAKMMAARLAPHMNKLVSNAQSTFIKKKKHS
jgi:hypothetical protein